MSVELPDGAELVPLEVVRASDRDWELLFRVGVGPEGREDGWLLACDCDLDGIPFEMMLVARRKPVDLDNDAGRCLVEMARYTSDRERREYGLRASDLSHIWDAACAKADEADR